MALGSSFSVTPAGLEEQAQQAKKRVPTQQALQTLSMQMPKTLGGTALAPSDRMMGAYRPGGIPDTSAQQMSRMVRAMSGRKAGSVKSATAPRFTQTTSTAAAQAAAPTSQPPMAPPKSDGMGPGGRSGFKPPQPPPRVRQGLTGSRDPSKLIGKVKAPVPVNPEVVGGGYVDSAPNPPEQVAAPPTPAPKQGGNLQYRQDRYAPGSRYSSNPV